MHRSFLRLRHQLRKTYSGEVASDGIVLLSPSTRPYVFTTGALIDADLTRQRHAYAECSRSVLILGYGTGSEHGLPDSEPWQIRCNEGARVFQLGVEACNAIRAHGLSIL